MRKFSVLLGASMLSLTGCSGSPDVKDVIVCLSSVMVIADPQASAGMNKYLQSGAGEKVFGQVTQAESEKLGREIRKEKGLDTMSLKDQRLEFLKIRNSSMCRKMHGAAVLPASVLG